MRAGFGSELAQMRVEDMRRAAAAARLAGAAKKARPPLRRSLSQMLIRHTLGSKVA